MDKLKNIILLLVFIKIQIITAQAPQNIKLDETIFIHTNGSSFVSGETLQYKVYCLKSTDKMPSNISKIAYVELVDNDKKSVFKTKIALENATGQGDYFIPTTLKTGNYKLIGYTNWMLNKPTSELFQLDINIVNPYKTVDTKTTENSLASSKNNTEDSSNASSVTNENVAFNFNKKTFTNRELVDLKIQSANTIFQDGEYSLSVRRLDNIPEKDQISAVDFSSKQSYTSIVDLQNQDKKTILPEIRGEMISGKISGKNSTDNINNIAIGLSIPGKSFAFKIVKTDSNGNFIFYVNKTYYTPDVIIHINDENANNYDLKINNAPEIDYSNLSFNPNSNLSYTIKESLLDRSISAQVENAYYHKKLDNIIKTPTLEPFYFPVAKEYILDDFTRFRTLRETMTEIATEMYHKQRGDKTYLFVSDPTHFPQLPESALVLVDGLYLESQNELMTYNMKNIYKIDVVVGRYYIGPKSFNGLINFTTFDNDFKSNQTGNAMVKASVLRPQPKKAYNKITYTDLTDNERIPDFRNQLFWNPDVKLNTESNNSFYTSDLSGMFEVRLEGFTKTGTPISLKEIIEVKNSL
ncbi:hypothetical protein QWY99_16530 [Flavobacterium branchiarum]|uniref:MG2 domain-containing protein n=1 Tax=Flavobacterium branchiarum TaxID=1114870 RepID=A0ABV5FM39_9FLAO|nr:hypothetical protein [Flavobacterium branchiarum]MDN3674649.1 hypothetical protein [Flavobacterium branchiarum]